MARRLRVALLVALLSLVMTGPASAAEPQTSPLERKGENRVLALVNAYRAQKGLAALTLNPVIRREARRHARYMSNQLELSHDGLAGRKKRIADADSGVNKSKICENAATAEGYETAGPMARKVVSKWKTVRALRNCMIDGSGFSTHSAGVGAVLIRKTWWLVFITANDKTP